MSRFIPALVDRGGGAPLSPRWRARDHPKHPDSPSHQPAPRPRTVSLRPPSATRLFRLYKCRRVFFAPRLRPPRRPRSPPRPRGSLGGGKARVFRRPKKGRISLFFRAPLLCIKRGVRFSALAKVFARRKPLRPLFRPSTDALCYWKFCGHPRVSNFPQRDSFPIGAAIFNEFFRVRNVREIFRSVRVRFATFPGLCIRSVFLSYFLCVLYVFFTFVYLYDALNGHGVVKKLLKSTRIQNSSRNNLR